MAECFNVKKDGTVHLEQSRFVFLEILALPVSICDAIALATSFGYPAKCALSEASSQ